MEFVACQPPPRFDLKIKAIRLPPPTKFITMRIFPSILALALVAGCATGTVKEFQAPDGTVIKTVKCTSDSTKCFALASQSCTNGGVYRVLSSESHAGGLAADLIPGPITWYAMTYACGASDGKMPEFKFTGQQYAPPSNPIVTRQRPTTTTCTPIGNTVTCNTY